MSHLPIFIISDNFEGEKCCSYPELRDEKTRRLEFNSSSLLILNSLEQLGYKVVTSGSFVASQVGEEMKCMLLEIIDFFAGKIGQVCSERVHLDNAQSLQRYVQCVA